MKKLILILLAAVAFSCGDGQNRASSDEGTGTEENSQDAVESDSTTMESDTTSTMGRQNQSDSLRNK